MSDNKKFTRRDFIKNAGLTGAASLLALSTGLTKNPFAQDADVKSEVIKVPTRIFGNTKVPVSILSMGGMYDIAQNQILLKRALDWGVNYWDTADCYEEGSEKGIGMYFEKYPESRKKVFLVTKSDEKSDHAGITNLLNRSLEKMKTDYIDLYFLHGINSPDVLTPELKVWVDKTKKEGKIKFFGFSTHRNMENCLLGASKLGWIDGIMMTYNYRLMHSDKMKEAVEACNKAGIGLTAMKTQGGGSVSAGSENELEMGGKFIQKGFTEQQAKLKAVWENQSISSICSMMNSLIIMAANVAAAVDKTKLETADLDLLKTYAEDTCGGYCAGCSDICDQAMGKESRIADIMRYMMYYNSYGDAKLARQQYALLPDDIKREIAQMNYSSAERVCPQKINISRIMQEASQTLA